MVGSEQRPAVGGDVADPRRLDPPPALVEELEEGEHQLDELLVEAPIVLLVGTLQASGGPAKRLARAAGQPGRAAGGGLRELEPGFQALPQPAQEPDGGRVRHPLVALSVALVHPWHPHRATA